MSISTSVKPPATEETKVYFLTLPKEMLCEVTKDCESLDLLKLRLVLPESYIVLLLLLLQCIAMQFNVTVNEASFNSFTGVCESAFFQRHVSEVIFVANALDRFVQRLRLGV